jgi:PAS domain-containing protein
VPVGHFIVSYQFVLGSLDAQAELSSRAVSSLVAASPTMWQFEQIRLAELLDRRPLQEQPEIRRIFDIRGTLVAESSDNPKPPLVCRKHNIYDAGNLVASIEISRSIYPLISQTILLAAGSIIVSIFVFIFLRNIPLQAIRKAYSSLEESETRYRTLYESMSEGVVLYSVSNQAEKGVRELITTDLNPAAELIFRTERHKAVGADLLKLFGEDIHEQVPEIMTSFSQAQGGSFEYQMSSISKLLRISVFSHQDNNFAALIEDVTEKKKSEEQIKKLAYYDVLTGLPNRQQFPA